MEAPRVCLDLAYLKMWFNPIGRLELWLVSCPASGTDGTLRDATEALASGGALVTLSSGSTELPFWRDAHGRPAASARNRSLRVHGCSLAVGIVALRR
jgi:hypothetical protein